MAPVADTTLNHHSHTPYIMTPTRALCYRAESRPGVPGCPLRVHCDQGAERLWPTIRTHTLRPRLRSRPRVWVRAWGRSRAGSTPRLGQGQEQARWAGSRSEPGLKGLILVFFFHTQMSWYNESHYTEKGIRSMNMLI